jgi:hypothetical protein
LNERSSTPANSGITARSSRLVERLGLGCISTWIVAMIQGVSQCPPHLGCVGFRPQRSDSEMLIPPSPRSFIPLVPLASQAERRIDRDILSARQRSLYNGPLTSWPSSVPAASANRANAGSDLVPVFVMIEARWFSTVRWLMPRWAAMFLLGWPARTISMT